MNKRRKTFLHIFLEMGVKKDNYTKLRNFLEHTIQILVTYAQFTFDLVII